MKLTWNNKLREICYQGKIRRRVMFNKKVKYKLTTVWNNNFLEWLKINKVYKNDNISNYL